MPNKLYADVGNEELTFCCRYDMELLPLFSGTMAFLVSKNPTSVRSGSTQYQIASPIYHLEI